MVLVNIYIRGAYNLKQSEMLVGSEDDLEVAVGDKALEQAYSCCVDTLKNFGKYMTQEQEDKIINAINKLS